LKVDRYVKDLFKRLEILSGSDGYNDGNDGIVKDNDDYYIERGMEPPRFAVYREARAKKCNVSGHKTYEDVYDSITQDELDYALKVKLRISPEKRYQDRKEPWYFHQSSWYMRKANGYDGEGCTEHGCMPDCRYYSETGRIEDEEVIREHKEIEELYRKRNAIINIDINEPV
jgi:hypothetical protein